MAICQRFDAKCFIVLLSPYGQLRLSYYSFDSNNKTFALSFNSQAVEINATDAEASAEDKKAAGKIQE